jgi:hypothetical protein
VVCICLQTVSSLCTSVHTALHCLCCPFVYRKHEKSLVHYIPRPSGSRDPLRGIDLYPSSRLSNICWPLQPPIWLDVQRLRRRQPRPKTFGSRTVLRQHRANRRLLHRVLRRSRLQCRWNRVLCRMLLWIDPPNRDWGRRRLRHALHG